MSVPQNTVEYLPVAGIEYLPGHREADVSQETKPPLLRWPAIDPETTCIGCGKPEGDIMTPGMCDLNCEAYHAYLEEHWNGPVAMERKEYRGLAPDAFLPESDEEKWRQVILQIEFWVHANKVTGKIYEEFEKIAARLRACHGDRRSVREIANQWVNEVQLEISDEARKEIFGDV